MLSLPDFERSLFLDGPAGSGKTTAASRYLADLINQGIPPDQILVIVPHPTLAAPYHRAISPLQMQGAPEITTLSGLARLALRPFWTLVLEQQGRNPAPTEPRFLAADLAQYHLHRFVQPYWEMGIFNTVRLPKYRVVTQILDSINNATLASLSFDEVAARLTAAWGDRHSSRIAVYETTMAVAHQYHDFCWKHGLLDFALQVSLLINSLLDEPTFQTSFSRQFRYCIVDNVEEMGALAHDFIFWCMESVDKTLIVFDQDGGYRAFLGADPTNAALLLDVCNEHLTMNVPVALSKPMQHVVAAAQSAVETTAPPALAAAPPGIVITTSTFYPQMIDDCVQQVRRLVLDERVPLNEIALITPYLNDALLFALQSRLQAFGIPTVHYRPSRPLRSEAPAQMLTTLMQLAVTSSVPPTALAVMQALCQAIPGLDPVRGALLTQAVYRPASSPRLELPSPTLRDRLPPAIISLYEQLRQWLDDHAADAPHSPEQFLSVLVSELLSLPGFAYQAQNNIPPIVADLIHTAERFSDTYARSDADDNTPILDDFFRFLADGFTSAAHEVIRPDAVLIVPAHTYLTRNVTVDYQFWLDAGDGGWYERIEQPLTHAFVLRRGFPDGAVWTDDMEIAVQEDSLHRLLLGLLRRCRQGLFVEMCDIGASGYEQRGHLLLALQQVFTAMTESVL